MIISEILELTKTKTIAVIAKELLTIGEKPAREAMKQAGCYSIVGKPGWFFDEGEDPENLNQSIYVFADQVKEHQNKIIRYTANLDSNDDYTDLLIPRKRHSFDLDVRLVKQLKIHCVKKDKTLYEVVEKSIRDYLEREDTKDKTAL